MVMGITMAVITSTIMIMTISKITGTPCLAQLLLKLASMSTSTMANAATDPTTNTTTNTIIREDTAITTIMITTTTTATPTEATATPT